jgi:hypothetical protein
MTKSCLNCFQINMGYEAEVDPFLTDINEGVTLEFRETSIEITWTPAILFEVNRKEK